MPNFQPPIPNSKSRLFVLVAGEASGDVLGADLIAGLKHHFPNARFAGVGGDRMRAAGLETWHSADKLSVLGLVEVLKHLPRLLALRRDIYRRTIAAKPCVFVGIDAPEFNIGLERKLKRAGMRSVHYVSPSVWAWREKRALHLGRSADRVLCLFPMEPPIYARYGVEARFVGHPLARSYALQPDQIAARRALGLPADARVLALLPGSRLGEIFLLGPDFIAAAALLRKQFPQLYIVAPMANARCRAAFAELIRKSGLGTRQSDIDTTAAHGISILSNDSREPDSQTQPSLSQQVLVAADAVLLASGTATLEAMLAKRPMVVAYRLSRLSYHIFVKTFHLLRISLYSLPNILAGRQLVPELMQDACTPHALANAIAPMLAARALPPDTLREFENLHVILRGDAKHDAAAAIADLLTAITQHTTLDPPV